MGGGVSIVSITRNIGGETGQTTPAEASPGNQAERVSGQTQSTGNCLSEGLEPQFILTRNITRVYSALFGL